MVNSHAKGVRRRLTTKWRRRRWFSAVNVGEQLMEIATSHRYNLSL